ncbi:MAG: LON peptidase substrate-binding domain-containing protein [Evtepia gabavorous]
MQTMPALALRGLTVYPKMMVHFDVGREASVKAIEESMSSNQPIFLVAQKDIRVEEPDRNHLFAMGTVSVVRQILRLPGKTIRVMVEGQIRARLHELTQTDPYLVAQVEPVGPASTMRERPIPSGRRRPFARPMSSLTDTANSPPRTPRRRC